MAIITYNLTKGAYFTAKLKNSTRNSGAIWVKIKLSEIVQMNCAMNFTLYLSHNNNKEIKFMESID